MSADRPQISRRRFLVVLGTTAVAAGAGALGMKIVDDSSSSKGNLVVDPTETLTPTGTVLPTSTEESPTETNTPTSTDTATATDTEISEKVLAEKIMGNDPITNWDGEKALPRGVNLGTYNQVYSEVNELYSNGTLKEGDVRYFDRVRELRENGSSFEFTRKDGQNFPKAKEIVSLADDLGKTVLTNLGYSSVEADEAHKLGIQILAKTFSWLKDGTILSRNSFPDDSAWVVREEELERHVCSVYSPAIEIGDEQFISNTLYLSNEAPIDFTFSVSDTGFDSKYHDLKSMNVKDGQGKMKVLSWRAHDLGSQPNAKAGMKAPDGYQGCVWASEITMGCGPEETSTPVSQKPGVQETQPGQPGQTPENTGIPPTRQFWPTPGSTNSDDFTQVPPRPATDVPLLTNVP